MPKPIYIIVHEGCLHDTSYPGSEATIARVEGIKREEEHRVANVPDKLPYGLDRTRPIRVVGAYYSGFLEGKANEPQCVDMQLKALRDGGYDAEVDKSGVILSTMNMEHPFRKAFGK